MDPRIEIWAAFEECIRNYSARKRGQIDEFCAKYHSWQGAVRIHAEAIKEDLTAVPLNTFWTIPFLTLRTSCTWLNKLGWELPNRLLGYVPSQIKTGSQRRIEWLFLSEFLELPCHVGLLKATKDSLADEFRAHPKLAPLQNDPEWKEFFATDPKVWKKEFAAYSSDRAAAADLASAGATLLTGWAIFGKGTLGALDMSDHFARRMAHRNAASHFFLGHKAGNVFYNFFPQEPTHTQMFAATVTVLAGVSALSLVIHALIDPVHEALGINRKKMNEFVRTLEEKLLLNVRTRMSKEILAGTPERARDGLAEGILGQQPSPSL